MTSSPGKSRCGLLVSFSFLLLGIPSLVYGGAYEWGGLGTRAQAMGGAYIGAADDWTALYWNPAGLTHLKGWGGGIDLTSPHVTMSDGDSLSNQLPANMETQYQLDTFAQYSGTEPTRFNQTEFEDQFYIPSGAGGYWSLAGFQMAAGFYVPAGYYLDWNDSIPFGAGTITADLFQELSITAFNLSLAKKVTSKLALGAGVEVLYGKIDYQANKTVANSGYPNSDYNWSLTSDSSGSGYEGVFGVQYRLTEHIDIGGVYRTGGNIDLEGDAQTQLTLVGLSETSAFVQKFRYPATYGLGLAFHLPGRVLLTTDWQRTQWSDFDIDIQYSTPGTALTNKNYSADWKDSNRYRIGAEWKPASRWALRGGYFYDESPLPDKSVSLSNIVGVNRHNVMLGVGYQVTKAIALDGIVHYARGDRHVNGVDYSQRVRSVGLSLSLGF